MTGIFSDVALAVGSSLAASLVVEASVTMVLALAGVRVACGKSAAVRHVMLVAAFAVLPALPVASILVRSVRVVQVPIMTGWAAEPVALPSNAGFTRVGDRVRTVFRERAHSRPLVCQHP
jgi:hypothetical protein